jgi:hypothetical protein
VGRAYVCPTYRKRHNLDLPEQKYKGSCYIGVVGSEHENDECRDSIEMIARRPKDELHFVRATKGYEARQMHLNNWYENTKHPFILFLDRDMMFPPHTLERLRSWKLPYISGAYMRRRFAPMAPVWFDYGPAGEMPMKPFTGIPMPDTLYRIGANGWGCVLLHRDVITAVRPLLKGEPEIIEDDMDVYPYDLPKIMAAIHTLEGMANGVWAETAELQAVVNVLKEEIRPLRGLKDSVGSDIRFPFYARLAGFDMYLDTGVDCGHMLNYPVKVSDYLGQSAVNVRDLTMAIHNDNLVEVERIQKAKAGL